MKNLAKHCLTIFETAILDYHVYDDENKPCKNPFTVGTFDHTLYLKNWIDTIQWHLEDIIRDPYINPDAGISIKRRIDRLNQERTNTVEHIDKYLYEKYKGITPQKDATINTESLGWAIDRLSILALKIYHVRAELNRADASLEHRRVCNDRLKILTIQRKELLAALNWLVKDIESGRKHIRVYSQLKMYNDVEFNPILYGKQ